MHRLSYHTVYPFTTPAALPNICLLYTSRFHIAMKPSAIDTISSNIGSASTTSMSLPASSIFEAMALSPASRQLSEAIWVMKQIPRDFKRISDVYKRQAPAPRWLSQ